MQTERNKKDTSYNQWNKKIKQVKKNNETKNWFFEKISTIDKPLARVTQKTKTIVNPSTKRLPQECS